MLNFNFRQLLRPMMLRRMKEDVEKSLAPKEETIVEVNVCCNVISNFLGKYLGGGGGVLMFTPLSQVDHNEGWDVV